MTSLTVCEKASNSALVDEVVIVPCLFADQLIGPLNSRIIEPCEDLRVLTSSAKAASKAI